jgi:hypothetical protein
MPRAASITAAPSFLVAPASGHALARADDADCPDRLGTGVENRHGDAALAEHGFFLLEGVAALSHRVEYPEAPAGAEASRLVG